jgi:hypothetical protein
MKKFWREHGSIIAVFAVAFSIIFIIGAMVYDTFREKKIESTVKVERNKNTSTNDSILVINDHDYKKTNVTFPNGKTHVMWFAAWYTYGSTYVYDMFHDPDCQINDLKNEYKQQR